jgi:hypothetical protein
MEEVKKQTEKYKQAIKSLDRERILATKNLKVNTSRVRIEGLLVKFYCSAYSLVKKMIVKPEFIKLYYKISDGEPFDLSLWDELSQAEKNFLFQIIGKVKPDLEREVGERQRKEAKTFFNKLYVNENQIRIGNNSPEIVKELKEAIETLIDRHLITKYLGNRLIKQYQQILDNYNIDK